MRTAAPSPTHVLARLLAAALLALLLLLPGCATPQPQRVTDEAGPLSEALRALGPGVDPDEADRLAFGVLLQTQRLAVDYELGATGSLLQNVLVNVGLRDRGLCWHYVVDLLAYIRTLELSTFDFHWAVAHEGYVKEHSVIVVTAKGAPFESGLVLDGWRHPHHLTWLPLREDVKYPWKRVEP
jgi:hypothetical protein